MIQWRHDIYRFFMYSKEEEWAFSEALWAAEWERIWVSTRNRRLGMSMHWWLLLRNSLSTLFQWFY